MRGLNLQHAPSLRRPNPFGRADPVVLSENGFRGGFASFDVE